MRTTCSPQLCYLLYRCPIVLPCIWSLFFFFTIAVIPINIHLLFSLSRDFLFRVLPLTFVHITYLARVCIFVFFPPVLSQKRGVEDGASAAGDDAFGGRNP